MRNINDNFQVVCDFKLINIIIGIQTCASRYSCPYCIGCKLDLEGNFSIKKGTYGKGALRTWKNIIDENERWLDETGGDRSKLKMFHNCEFKPISIKSEKEHEEIFKTFPLTRGVR